MNKIQPEEFPEMVQISENESQKQTDREDNLARLRRLRPIDDTFMRVIFRDDIPLTEFVLRMITGDSDLSLTVQQTQKDLTRLTGARGLSLDVYAEDTRGQLYNLEVQRDDKGACPERIRYHSSALDVENLRPCEPFEALPTLYVIFITENDVFGAGSGVYFVKRVNLTTGMPYEDRVHILYANAAYKGDDPLGRLMHDFLCSDPDQMRTPILAEKARFYKTDSKGVDHMCKIMDEMKEEAFQRGHAQGIEQGTDQTRMNDIKSIMSGFSYTAIQAMNLLNIPPAEQRKYLAKL